MFWLIYYCSNIHIDFLTVLWIRIHIQGLSRVDLDSDPEPYPFQPNVKLNHTSFKKFQYTF
jgi:hypothetical protein